MRNNWGQSLIEVVFSIGLIMLVVMGVIMLLVNTIGARTKSYERIKAVELSQIAMENLVSVKATNATEFWDVNSAFWIANKDVALTHPSFPGYDYVTTITPNLTAGCTPTTCMEVVISVGWSGSFDGERDNFNRFFSRN